MKHKRFTLGGFCPGVFVLGVFVGGFMSGGFLSGGFCPRTVSSNTITLFNEEIMATKLTIKESYFDEYEEMNSNESSSEED